MVERSSTDRLIGELLAEVKNINRRLDEMEESIQSLSKDRWTARGILIAVGSVGTILVSKAGVILAALAR